MGDRGQRQAAESAPLPTKTEPLKPPPTDTAWLKTAGQAVEAEALAWLGEQKHRCATCGGDPAPGGEITPDRGVWVVYYHDMGPHVESVHGSELEALRQINDATGKQVAFVPFGSEVREVLR